MFLKPLVQQPTAQDVSDESNPRVFMDVSINGGPPKRMIIELFANVVPKTAENFRALCTGEKGLSETTGKPLSYKGAVFDLINKDLYVQGGDISDGKRRTSGESIYGGYFDDENFQLLHTERGLLSMANVGANTNGSKFHITFAPLSLFDGFNVVFGKVIQGMSTLSCINEMVRRNSRKPSGEIRITDCGQIPQDKGKEDESLKRAGFCYERPKGHSNEILRKPILSSLPGLLQLYGDEVNVVMGSDLDIASFEAAEHYEDEVNILMEFDLGQKEKSLKRDVFSGEHSDEREKKRRKYSPSSLPELLQISETAEISEKENNVMASDQDKGFPRMHPRQEGGGGVDSVKKLSWRQIEWLHTSIRDIAIAGGDNIPEFPDS